MIDSYTVLFEKLTRLEKLLRFYRGRVVMEYGPLADKSRGQGRVLKLLKLQPEISTRDLAYLLGIRQQSLNELLNKLEEKELVERKPSEEDKRVMIVHLTEKGKEAEQPQNESYDFFSVLSDEEQMAFSDYLDRLIDAVKEKIKKEFKTDKAVIEDLQDRFGDNLEHRLSHYRDLPPVFHPGPPHEGPGHGPHGPHGQHAPHDKPKGKGKGKGKGKKRRDKHGKGKKRGAEETTEQDD